MFYNPFLAIMDNKINLKKKLSVIYKKTCFQLCATLMKNAGIWPVNANIIPESKLIAYNNELFTSSNATLRSHNNVALDNSCVPGCNITVNDTIVLDVSFKDIVPIPKLKPTKRNTEESENITSFPYKIRIEESI